RQIREDVGNPKIVMLGVDRMDYTKGIRHRLKAYGELLAEGRLNVEDVVLIQIATPSRERLEQYKIIRHDVELAVGRINGEQVDVGSIPVRYLHHSYPRDEMTAFFLAADVMLVTALRDGMNLVAKEYVACRKNDDGALVLSEFTGAAEQLKGAVMINPHDIGNLKAGILEAVEMDERTRRRRMRQLRKKVTTDTVSLWSENFLAELPHLTRYPESIVPAGPVVPKRRTAAAADSPAAPSDRAHQPEEAGWAADISTAREEPQSDETTDRALPCPDDPRRGGPARAHHRRFPAHRPRFRRSARTSAGRPADFPDGPGLGRGHRRAGAAAAHPGGSGLRSRYRDPASTERGPGDGVADRLPRRRSRTRCESRTRHRGRTRCRGRTRR